MQMTSKQHMQQVIIFFVVVITIVCWFMYFQANRIIAQIQTNESQKVWWEENYKMIQQIYNSDGFKQQQKASIQQALSQMNGQGTQPNQPTANNQPTPSNQWAEETSIKKLSLDQLKKIKDDAYILGNKDAKVLILEYSDLQCPFCKRHFESKTLETIVSKYQWQVSKAMRQFPLSFHPYAQKAGEGAECFAQWDAEKYFTFVGAIFAKDLNTNGNDQVIYEVNKQLWWNESSFKTCVESWKNSQRIKDQMAEWSTLFGISWTPGNVIINTENGEYVVLAWAYPAGDFEKIIDQFLK